ncbi:hypothetical protein ACHAXA_008074 [Cyclostephanos tholiformis]|uniref:Uncharacterized protein n=1 Tax=Cyclostephanos tholiformis TaxID=382380 RepID=A0ABD3RVP7_9STRA
MVKTKDGKNVTKSSDKTTAAAAATKNNNDGGGGGGGGGKKLGLDEIDTLFANKRQMTREMQERRRTEEEESRIERKRRKRAREEEEAEEIALRGSCSSSSSSSSSSSPSSSSAAAAAAAGGGGKGDAIAPSHLHERATKMKSLTYTREDIERLNGKKADDQDDDKIRGKGGEARDRWASDGLGGVFNGEGYTGRRDGGGHRVFKAHLMNKRGFGNSPDCPFDCDCCFI